MEGGPPSSCLQRGAPCHGIIGIMVNPPLGLVRIKLWAIHMNRNLLGLCLVAVVIFDEVTTLHRLYDNFW